jgi:hypothetical protein
MNVKTIAKLALTQAPKSATMWLGVAWAALSFAPDLLNGVVGVVGPVTPELAARLAAASLMAARLRSLVKPLAEGALPH